MNIINNQYRIIKKITTSKNNIKRFIVENLLEKHKTKYELKLIDIENLDNDCIQFLQDNLLLATTQNTELYLKSYNFEKVFDIDGGSINKELFIYTTEYVESSITLLDFAEKITPEQMLQIIVTVLKTFNFIELYQITYTAMTLNNINIIQTDNKIIVKLNDIITSKLLDLAHFNKFNNKAIYDFEYYYNTFKNFLISLLARKEINTANETHTEEIITKYDNQKKSVKNQEIMNCIFDIYYNLKKTKLENEEYNFFKIIEYINSKLNRHFSLIATKKNNKEIIFFNREKEKSEVLSYFQQLKNGKSLKKILFISAEIGTGKTSFLKELEYILLLERSAVYSIPTLSKFDDKNFLMHILQIFLDTSNNNYTLYANKIIKEINLLFNKINKSSNKEKTTIAEYKLINRISNVILENTSSEFSVLLIDDIHLASNFITELLMHLVSELIYKKNIMVIASGNEHKLKENIYNKKITAIFNLNKNTSKIKLENLSLEQSYNLISKILNTNNIPAKLVKKIYNYTGGKSFFINKTIEDLISNKEILEDLKLGRYIFSKELLDQNNPIQICKNIENIIKEIVNKLSKKELILLNAMSLFKNSFKTQEISKLVDLNRSEIEKHIASFLENNLLIKKENKKYIEYTFENKILKYFLYNNLDKSYKINGHRKILNMIKNEKNINIKELLWQSEKAKLTNVTINYCIENKIEINKDYNYSTYVYVFEKALSFIKDNNINTKLKILLIIAEAHLNFHNIDKLKPVLKQAQSIVSRYNVDINLKTALQILIFSYEIEKNTENEKIKKTLIIAEKQVKEANNILLELKFLNAKIKFLEKIGNYAKALKLSKKVIKLCGTNTELEEQKAIGLLNLGNTFYFKQEFKNAKKTYKEAIALSTNIKHRATKIAATNNLAIICNDIEHNFKLSISYFNSIINNSQETTNPSIEIFVLCNIATTYKMIGQYNEAYKYCKQAMKKLSEHYLPNRIIFSNLLMYEILLLQEKIEEALSYKEKIKFLLNKKDLLKEPIYYITYHKCNGNLFNYLKKYNEEKKELEKIDKIEYDEVPILKFVAKCLLETNKLASKKKNDTSNLISDYETIFSEKKFKQQIHTVFYNMISNISQLILQHPALQLNKVLRLLTKVNIPDLSKEVLAYKIFLQSFLTKKNKEKHLQEAEKLLIKSENISLKIDVRIELGLYYFNKNDINTSIIKFCEAQTLIKKLMKKIPSKYFTNFFNSNKYRIPFLVLDDFLNNRIQKNYDNFNKKMSSTKIKKLISSNTNDLFKTNKSLIENIVRQEINKSEFKNKKMEDIINNFSDNFLQNIDTVTKFISKNLLATSYDIIIKEDDYNFISILNTEKNNTILKITAAIKNGYNLASNVINNKDLLNHLIIPLWHYDNIQNEKDILAYLIFTSEKEINNFTQYGIDFCTEVSNLVAFLIESHLAKKDAYVDRLTTAVTRERMETKIKDLIFSTQKTKAAFALLMYDLDKFKNVNDSFGHQIGDIVLKKTVMEIKKIIKHNHLIGRFGGEEFIILLPKINKTEALGYAEKIRNQVEKIEFNIPNLKITISIGISLFPENGDNITELLLKADQALYKSKNTGRNKVSIWNEQNKIDIKNSNIFTDLVSERKEENKKNIITLLDSIGLVKKQLSKPQKLKIILDRIIESIDADTGIFIPIKKDLKIANTINKKTTIKTNKKIIDKVLKTKKGIFEMDWNSIAGRNKDTKIPNWNSIMIIPIIRANEIISLIYLTVNSEKKEFSLKDFNLANILAKTILPYF